MERHTGTQDPQQSALQEQAIQEAKLAYSRLPHGDAIFQQCVQGKETLAEVLDKVELKRQSHKRRKSNKFLEKLQKYTTWLQNISSVVDVAVQVQAGIGCPLWAPIKLVLKISDDDSKAIQHVLNILESIIESLPRLEIYEKLESDKILQVALLNVFTDVVDFSVRAFEFLRRGTLVRLVHTVVRSFDQDVGSIVARLERHAKQADQTAVATELIRAAEFRKAAEQRQHEDIKIQWEKWLKPSDVKRVHLRSVEARLEGTCDWILSHTLYETWTKSGYLTAKDRLLIISGTHGCGKSVLASSIVVELNKVEQHTLFFAFSSSDGSRQNSENLIRTLLWQLAEATANKEALDTVYRMRLGGQPTVSKLWEAFEDLTLSLAKPVYCIVDGIDECIDFDRLTFAKLALTLERCPNLRILMLGRPHAVQANSSGASFGVLDITSSLLDKDIKAFILDEVAKSDILSRPELRERAYQKLKDKSDGMFLWIRLMVDDLKKSTSRNEFNERLENMPRGLEKAYQLVFLHLSQRLDSFELRLSQRILAFTVSSCRPLTFEEFRYAHALNCRSLDTSPQHLEEYLLFQPPEQIVDVTGGLVSVTDGVFRLAHSSIKDFLLRPEDRWTQEPDQAVLGFRVDPIGTHRSLAWLCLDYLGFRNWEKVQLELHPSQSLRTLCDSHPLLEYATLYTFYHLNRSGSPSSTTLAKIENLLKSPQSVFWLERFAHLQFEDLTLGSQIDEYETFQDRLINSGIDSKFLAIFENTLHDVMRRMRENGDPRNEQLEILLTMAAEDNVRISGEEECRELRHSDSGATASGHDVQTQLLDPMSNSKGSMAILNRLKGLLSDQNSMPIAHQIEIFLKLSCSLRTSRALADPLKILFRLILRKASSIPVFALIAVAKFYQKFEKHQEALEVYTTASRKVAHLEIALKYYIIFKMGRCYGQQCLHAEALAFYEKAFYGYESMLGKRHQRTLICLQGMISMNSCLDRKKEVLRLCNKMYIGQDNVPELNIKYNLRLQLSRTAASRHMGEHNQRADMVRCLQTTFERFCNSASKGEAQTGRYLGTRGDVFSELGDYSAALDSYQLAYQVYERSKGKNHVATLCVFSHVADVYYHLERYIEAQKLYDIYLAKLQRVLGPGHPWTQTVEEALETLFPRADYTYDSRNELESAKGAVPILSVEHLPTRQENDVLLIRTGSQS